MEVRESNNNEIMGQLDQKSMKYLVQNGQMTYFLLTIRLTLPFYHCF